MEIESQKKEESETVHETPKKESKALLILNIIILSVGACGSPLILRFYFLKGGSSIWLTSCLQTAGFPFVLIPIFISYFNSKPTSKPYLITFPVLIYCTLLGISFGLDDFLYAYGIAYLPVSTSSLLVSTQLVFTALFAFFLVKQKFSAYSINAIALLSMGAVVLGITSDGDRPKGESERKYYIGFAMMILATSLYGLLLPLVELMYAKVKEGVMCYRLVMEVQFVLGFFATAFCVVGMIVNRDFQNIGREAKAFEKGESSYYMVLVGIAISTEFFYLGTVGVIHYASALVAGIIFAVLIPVTEVLAVIFFHEKFDSGKGVALALSVWGFVSYFYGEFKADKKKKKSIVLKEASIIGITN